MSEQPAPGAPSPDATPAAPAAGAAPGATGTGAPGEAAPAEAAPTPDMNAVREDVQRILIDQVGRVEVDRSGLFSFPYGSARVFVNVTDWDGGPVVNVWAYTNVDLKPSEELYRYVAMQADAWIFGHMGAKEQPDGNVSVVFRNTLLGVHMTPEELMQAVGAVGWTADQVDEEIKGKFGGRLPSEPPPGGSPPMPQPPVPVEETEAGSAPRSEVDSEGGYL